MPSNFKVFSEQGTNLFNDVEWASSAERLSGFLSNTVASSKSVNTSIKTAVLISCALLEAIANSSATVGLNSSLLDVTNYVKAGLIVNPTTKEAGNILKFDGTTWIAAESTDSSSASDVAFDNSTSSLSATNVQSAIDEVVVNTANTYKTKAESANVAITTGSSDVPEDTSVLWVYPS